MTQKNVKHVLGNGTEQSFIRLFADDGKALTNDGGKTIWNCVDAESASGWTEIDAPTDDEEDLDDSEALNIILGGVDDDA